VSGARILTAGDGRVRVVPWRGDPTIAYVTPVRGHPTPSSQRRVLEQLPAEGYQAALTAALPPPDQRLYLQAGFEVHERLHLLQRPVDPLPVVAAPNADLRRGRHADRAGVIDADSAAFPAFWRLDLPGLQDALAATPSSRLRVASAPGDRRVVGYAVTGRAGPRGYLQRLAVDPARQRHGVGAALVLDGLRWLRRWGAKEVLVNTQEENERAVRLYQRLGFTMQPQGLAVLRLPLDPSA
jgi:ribosomal protein S18 acetylase RimI-like enzyme